MLWAPGGGGETANSIADVLTGKVSPSGHLPDTFAFDALSSPAMQNMGDFNYKGTDYYYVNYSEGIYVGYKYYETRYEDIVTEARKCGHVRLRRNRFVSVRLRQDLYPIRMVGFRRE